ncbi:MAG: CinA family protein [Pseudomonadota bacterium]
MVGNETDEDFGMDDPIYARAETLVEKAGAQSILIATAESCTGGMIAAAITDVPGSSMAFDRGFVTYSNEAKTEMLGADADVIEQHGAVSEVVATAMAEGALARSNADVAVSVTGIAGPGGGSPEKAVGLVWFACASLWAPTLATSAHFDDNGRAYIRHHSVLHALEILLDTIDSRPVRTDTSDVAGHA